MSHTPRRAILVVSFGTSFEETRKKNIDRIEQDIKHAYPSCPLYRAWISKWILQKLRKRDQIHIFTIQEALEQMLSDGITELAVQPTHVINGLENEAMKAEILSYAGRFDKISFGNPLLTLETDILETVRELKAAWSSLPENEALVFMGHGTSHYANTVYAALDYACKDLGYPNLFVGTVEAYPSIDSLLRQVTSFRPAKVHLTPFMIVAGDHANHDMAGDDPSSWRCRFEAAGFPVECHLRGLGEYECIRRIFLRHVQEALLAL